MDFYFLKNFFFILPYKIIYCSFEHREHTILLSRKRANKGTKRMNSLLLSSLAISHATLQGKPLLTSPVQCSSAKLEPRPFNALKKILLVYV